MKILQIAPNFPPYVGGQERYVYNLSRELVKMGHEVCVLASGVPGSPLREIVDGIEVIRFACLARPLRNPLTPGLLFTGGRFRSFDIIHAHNEHSFAANAAVFLKRRLRLPLVITCHGHGGPFFGKPLPDLLEKVYTVSIGRATLASADMITAATPSEKRFLVRLGIDERKLVAVPVGIDLAKWDSYSGADVSESGSMLGLDGRRLVLFASQAVERKGLEYLVSAMPLVVESFPDAVCVVAGEGESTRPARELARKLGIVEQVRFTGWLNDAELAQAYRSAGVFVLPSLLEGQPTCLMEAFAFSVPVVATDIPGPRDYFRESALLVPPADPAALSTAIICLLQNPEEAGRMGKRGRALVEQSRFSWKSVAESMEGLYRNLRIQGGPA